MAVPYSHLLGRRLAHTAGPVACLVLIVLIGGARGQAALEGLPLGVALGALHRQTGDQVVWVDTGAQQDPASVALGLAALAHAKVRGVVIDVPLGDAAGSGPSTLESRLTALPTILVVPPGDQASDPVIPHLPPAPFTPPPLSGIAPLASALAGSAGALAVEPLGKPDADGVWRESALVAGPPSAPYPGAALVALSIARGQNPRTLKYFDASRLLVGGKPLPVGRGGAVVPFYGPAAGEANGLRRVTLSELTEPEFDATTLDGRLVVLGHTPDLVTALGARSGTEILAERIEALDSGAYAARPAWAGAITAALALATVLLASIAVPPLTRRHGLAPTLLVAVLGSLAIVLAEILLLVQGGRYLPLVWPAALWFAATLGAGLGERRRLAGGGRDPADAATIISHAPPMPSPARRATDLRAIPASAAAPARARAAAGDAALARTGSFQRNGGFLRTGTFPARGHPAAASPAPATRTAGTRSGEPLLPGSLEELDRALRSNDAQDDADVATRLLTGRAAASAPPSVAHYEIERELGRGAISTVYLARDSRDGRRVALKAINVAEEGDAGLELRTRFFREAETASRLSHPGIVRVHDFGEQGKLAYLAMEYADGQLLSEYTSSSRLLPTHDVLEIVAQIADALEHAHSAGVVHRDIKPANAIVRPESLSTKVTDFGIAKLSDQAQTRAGVVLGTPSFMAPEQLEGGTVTGRSDLFALGVTLFQLLTGQLPFMADSMPGLMEKIATAPHPPLAAIRPDLPAGLGEIIDRALEKDPERRYGSAGEMARALRACAAKLLI